MSLLPRLRPMWSTASRTMMRPAVLAPYSTEPTKKTTPPAAITKEAEQSMPRGAFYDHMVEYRIPQPNHFPRDVPATSTPGEKMPEPKPKQDETKHPAPELKPKVEPAKQESSEKEKPSRKPTKARIRKKAGGTTSGASAASTTSSTATSTSTSTSSTTSTSRASSSAEQSTDRSAAEEKARVVFGSSLAGPYRRAERIASLRNQSKIVAGVLVPPKPEEPDNCCMSGCVNCVWEQFREDMEMWAGANDEAQRRLAARRVGVDADADVPGAGAGVSMDDDGGGSETNWSVEPPPKIAKDLWDDELYRNVPVGIREFMKQEKRLKERKEGKS